jgi:hypothetical protein
LMSPEHLLLVGIAGLLAAPGADGFRSVRPQDCETVMFKAGFHIRFTKTGGDFHREFTALV